MSDPIPLPNSLFDTYCWSDKPGAIWVSSLLTLHRNMGHYRFPNRLEKHEVDQVNQLLTKGLSKAIEGISFFPEDGIKPTDRELLFEHFLSLTDFSTSPNGGVFAIDPKGDLLATLNLEDHLVLRTLHPGDQWEGGWKKLCQIEGSLSASSPFTFSSKFGYLTADPGLCGTGLQMHAFLHIPALIQMDKLEETLATCNQEAIHFMGLRGNLQETFGDLLIVENSYTLGLTEEGILSGVQEAATKLLAAEEALRFKLEKERPPEIKDLVSKSYGLLLHSYKLETAEALDLLSLMKLGLALKMVVGIEEKKVNELFFKCRRGSLSRQFPDLVDPAQFAHKRAELLHKELGGAKLTDDLQ